MFGVCAHTVGIYINKYKTHGLSSLIPAPINLVHQNYDRGAKAKGSNYAKYSR